MPSEISAFPNYRKPAPQCQEESADASKHHRGPRTTCLCGRFSWAYEASMSERADRKEGA